jgi:hypothetical protein
MKKVILMAALISSLAIVSCKKDAPAPTPPPEVPADVPAPPEPTPTPEAPVKDESGTTVTVGKDGVDVQTKSETKSTTVEVNKKGAAVEVKK